MGAGRVGLSPGKDGLVTGTLETLEVPFSHTQPTHLSQYIGGAGWCLSGVGESHTPSFPLTGLPREPSPPSNVGAHGSQPLDSKTHSTRVTARCRMGSWEL